MPHGHCHVAMPTAMFVKEKHCSALATCPCLHPHAELPALRSFAKLASSFLWADLCSTIDAAVHHIFSRWTRWGQKGTTPAKSVVCSRTQTSGTNGQTNTWLSAMRVLDNIQRRVHHLGTPCKLQATIVWFCSLAVESPVRVHHCSTQALGE